MNKENVIIKLQIAMYLLNFAAVCLVTGTMIFSIFETVDSMNASSFWNLYMYGHGNQK